MASSQSASDRPSPLESEGMGPSSSPPRKSGPGRWIKRIAISALSAMFALGGVEWIIQRYWPVGGCILGLDEELLFAPIPNSSHVQFMTRQMGGRSIVVRVNSHGMLGAEPDEQRARPRWMVFGDSFVMAENEPFEYTYAARLAEHWENKVEVLCAGVTGYGPDQTLLRMQRMLPKYQPEGVVYVVCSYNDYGDPVRNHLMHFDEQGALVHRPAQPAPSEAAWFREQYAESKKLGLARLWINYWRLQGWDRPERPDATLISDYLRAHREDYKAHVELGETTAIGMLRDVFDADVALYPDRPSSQYKVRMMRALFGEIKALHDRLGIELAFVVVPGGVDLDPDSWLRVDTSRFPTYERDRLSRVATELAQELDIPVLNLFPGFEEQATQQDLYEGPVDPHWNRNGMDLGARMTVQFMEEQGLGPLK